MNQNTREYCGLENQGMTCYLNVVLQTLYMTKEYREQFRRSRIRHDSSDGKLIDNLKELFNKLDKRQGLIRPSRITRTLGIKVSVQQDAAEHLECILSKTPEYSKIFMGMMQKTRTCKCLKKTPSQTKFYMLQISPDNLQDVEDALNAYMKPREQSDLYCRACQNNTKMTTDSTIIDFPKILILQLQENTDIANSQYKWTYEGNLKVKLRSHIDVLDRKYELYAIVKRSGTFDFGHYYVHIKSEEQTWYLFDDSIVSQSDFNMLSQTPSLNSADIYLLMYRQQTGGVEHTNEHERRQHEVPKSSAHRYAIQKSDEYDRSLREDPKLISGQNEYLEMYRLYRSSLKSKYQTIHEEIHSSQNSHNTEDLLIDESSAEKRCIKYNNIFKAPRTVLTKGEADTGKIPSVVKFILDCTVGKANQDIEYIFPIPFHKLNILAEEELNLLELVQNTCENTAGFILEESNKVLIILEGLHEAQLKLDFEYSTFDLESFKVNELLTHLIKGTMFPNVMIWITSDLTAADSIPVKYINLVTMDCDFNQCKSGDESSNKISPQEKISVKTQSLSLTNYPGNGGADKQQKSEAAKMLRSCSIKSCAALSTTLKLHLSHLRELDLSGNSFGDSGLKQLSALLADPQCKLEKLLLISCLIGEGGCTSLSSDVRFSHLRELDLSENSIGLQGMKVLSDLLADPQCKLEKLGLCSCCIKEEGYAAQASITSSNRCM